MCDMYTKIHQHLNQYDDYDVRRTHSARFIDQKVTPDVLCFVAECIANYIGSSPDREFTRMDIQDSQYAESIVQLVFGKPSTRDPLAGREYDKFFGQPLSTLAHAHILEREKRGRSWYYTVTNPELLEYIATKDRYAFVFLVTFLEQIMSDSGFFPQIQNYRQLYERSVLTKNHFNDLKSRWERFLIGNTDIDGVTECRRIWPKVINIFAVHYQLPGTVDGRMSPVVFTFNDLMYNRPNWRDIDKCRNITRREAAESQTDDWLRRQIAAEEYRITKAMRIIRQKYRESELRDQWGQGPATCVHHIFSQSDYPQIVAHLENLIKLTVQQHDMKAHPNQNYSVVDRDYQLSCLLAKSESIDRSLALNEFLYSKESFVYVVNTGLNTQWQPTLGFDNIRTQLVAKYNEL